MTIDEATSICKQLTAINVQIWNCAGEEKSDLIQEFRRMSRQVVESGFKIRRFRKNGLPMFKPRVPRHVNDVEIKDNRPEGCTVKGDCTTRCISFCTGIDYDTVKREQLVNAKHAGYVWTWKHQKVWSQSLVSRGFSRIVLTGRKISRATFLKYAKSLDICTGIIATVSSGHVAAIDMASRKILDTWNSSCGRIECIYVPKAQMAKYANWLRSMNVPCLVDMFGE